MTWSFRQVGVLLCHLSPNAGLWPPSHLPPWALSLGCFLCLVTTRGKELLSQWVCGGEDGRWEPRDSKDHVLCLAHVGLPDASPHGWTKSGCQPCGTSG